jgi:rhodanese-related sulfurtransferase
MLKNTLIRVLVIVACAAGLGLADQWRRPVKLSLAPNAAPVPVAPDTATSAHTSSAAAPATGSNAAQIQPPAQPPAQPQGPHVTLAQAYDLWNQGVTFLDARTKTEYLAGHIRGAKLLDPSEFTSNESRALIATLHPSLPLVIYCGGGDCHASENLAIFLQQAGYQQLHILHEGFPAWKSAGYDITTGDQP